MTPTGPNTNPEDSSSFQGNGGEPDFVEISLLLRGNAVQFIIMSDQLPRLEEILTSFLHIPLAEPKVIKLETTVGIITFLSSHFTGWIVVDDPIVEKLDKTP